MESSIEVDKLLDSMAEELKALIATQNIHDPLIVGIHTGGAWVAQYLHKNLGLSQPLGTLDISFYRDDFTRIGINPRVRPSKLPFNVDDRHIILVDDVLHTGRTIRAALNEIFDYGRPASVALAVLVERSGRELPIQAGIVGQHINLGTHEQVKLVGPEELKLTIIETP